MTMTKKQLQYQKIEDTIISQIRNGELKQGDRLPSENELSNSSMSAG